MADPEPVSRLGLVALFNAQAGLRVVAEAESVAQVRALCQKWRPELLVIDPALDVGEGMAFLRELPRCSAGTRAVAFTGRVDAASVQAAIQAGACGFVARRDPAAALVAAVLAALRGERHLGPRVEALLLDGMAHGALSVADKLSERERQIFRLLGEGRTTRELAAQLHVSVKTIESHIARMKEKLGAHSGAELRARAVLAGRVE